MENNRREIITRKSWSDFRSTGLLLYINQVLHIFGWAIVFDIDDNGSVKEVYPARVKFRGFDDASVSDSYTKLTHHMKDTINELVEDVKE